MDPSSSAKWQMDSNSDDELEQPNSKRSKKDVFINYSYEDIGKQFISYLQGALSRRGFTISDHTMLPAGQNTRVQLLKAIEESEIYVVVFSTNYASSVRSLDELVEIMDWLGKSDQRKILPVFYKAEPSDVRSQQGSLKEAFQAHEADEDIDSERVQKWKQALKDAGRRSGLPFQNGDEEKFVWEIVELVEKMQSPQQLRVADHPVVIGSRAEELISKLRLDRDEVLLVAVFGISGIGKTTIVKATYNEITSKFNVSCFLEDIDRRYNERGDWKLKLQKDLISQITKDGKVKLPFDGVLKIQNLLRHKKTLLVLDDVDHFKRLEGLGINPRRFYKGSRIIVTTRDVDSLGGIPHTSYHTRLLNKQESQKLFIQLMFERDEPVHAKFVEEVVARAGGLPLVLKVWSRHFTQYKEHLPAALKTLKQIPHGDVQKQLQMSYDLLSAESKNLFLDIACFFNRMIKSLVIKVLNDEDFDVDYEIEKLAHKFLVKNICVVSLSHVIKEMGHEVVRQENPEEPGQRTRLMGQKDVVRVFREYLGTDSVRSIRLDYDDKMEERETVQLEAFKNMSNLRFIMLANSKLQWSCSSNDDTSACFSFKHLKYLHWNRFPCKSLDNIDMRNVVVIRLESSKLETLWEGANKNLKKLKILNVSHSSSLNKTGNFIGLDNLEILDLSLCSNLKELDSHPNSLCQLHQLTTITLRKCTNLQSIPDLPPNIKCLEAHGCKNLVNLPSNIFELQNLKTLWLNDCLKLRSEGFTQVTGLTNLQVLGMGNCNVSQVSTGIGNLVSLRRLDLSGNPFSSLPETFINLSKLEKLFIDECCQLQLLPPLPSQLTEIEATKCGSLDVMPFDSMQNAYIFPTNRFKELFKCTKALYINLLGKEVPEWCTYRNKSGNVLSFVAPIQLHTKIYGLIICATHDKEDCDGWYSHIIYNKTKGTSHPLNDTTLLLEAGDTVEFQFKVPGIKSCGLRLIYEDDVVDSGLVLKDVREPTLSLFPLPSEIMTGNKRLLPT